MEGAGHETDPQDAQPGIQGRGRHGGTQGRRDGGAGGADAGVNKVNSAVRPLRPAPDHVAIAKLVCSTHVELLDILQKADVLWMELNALHHDSHV